MGAVDDGTYKLYFNMLSESKNTIDFRYYYKILK